MNLLMRPRTWALAAAAALLAIALVVLGGLQLRWLDQVAETLTAEKRASLYRRGSALATDLERELARVFFWFQIGEAEDADAQARLLAERWRSFRQAGRHVALVSDVWLCQRCPDVEPPVLLRLSPDSGALIPAPWPPGTTGLPRQMAEGFPPFGLLRSDGPDGGTLLAVPAEHRPGPPRSGRPVVLIRLDRGYLESRLLPALASPHLGGGDQGQGEPAVVEVNDADGRRLLAWPPGVGAIRPDEHDRIVVVGVRPDLVSAALLAGMQPPRRPPPGEDGPGLRRAPPPGGFGRDRREGPGAPGVGPSGGRRTGGLRMRPGGPPPGRAAPWQLSLGYAEGPVDALVTGLRRRNLALGFSILGLLGGAIGALGLAMRRAQNLAERQRQFMASVSHELRTPLAVIGSAAENLRDGTVDDGDRVREYGDMIHAESKRLTAMVDDVLRLAAGQDLRENLRLEPMDVRDVVEAAIDSFQQELRARGGTLETVVRAEIDGPPMVMADAEALRQAVENVVGNAIKYGGDPPAVTVRISRVTSAGGADVLIAVEDRGLGIPADELSQVFEPFFRGREPMKRQIRGTGLGLSLVTRIMKAHGGSVSAESTPGQGSRFVLRLPSPAQDTRPMEPRS